MGGRSQRACYKKLRCSLVRIMVSGASMRHKRLANSQKLVSGIKLALRSSANRWQVVVYDSVKTGFELNTYSIMPIALMSGLLSTTILLVMHSPAVGRSITNMCVGLLSW